MEGTRMSFANDQKMKQKQVMVSCDWQSSKKQKCTLAIGRLVDEESEDRVGGCKSQEDAEQVEVSLKKHTSRYESCSLDCLVLDRIIERLESIEKRISQMDNNCKSPMADVPIGEANHKYKWANIIRSGGITRKKIISPQTPPLRIKEAENPKLKKIYKSRASQKQGNGYALHLMKNKAIAVEKKTPKRIQKRQDSQRQCKTRRRLGLVNAEDEVCSNLIPVQVTSSSSSLKILGSQLNTISKPTTKGDNQNIDLEILYGKDKNEIDPCSLPIRLKNLLLDYLLDAKLPPSTLLISTLGQDANRKEFRSLAPCEWLQCEVLNCYAALLTINTRRNNPTEHSQIWYMPTWFQQYSEASPPRLEVLYNKYLKKENFGGCIDAVEKICIPMNWKNMHWYLFVIDMKNETIHIYDSLPVKEFNFNRLCSVMHVRNMLHEALAYGLGKAYQKDISKFPCIRPEWCPRQPNGNDCGIYVMYFMKHVSEMEAEMVVSFVSDEERCALALELFLHPSNLVREDNLGVLPCMK